MYGIDWIGQTGGEATELRSLRYCPAEVERGAIAHLDGSTYVYLRGRWVNLSGDPCLPSMQLGFRYA